MDDSLPTSPSKSSDMPTADFSSVVFEQQGIFVAGLLIRYVDPKTGLLVPRRSIGGRLTVGTKETHWLMDLAPGTLVTFGADVALGYDPWMRYAFRWNPLSKWQIHITVGGTTLNNIITLMEERSDPVDILQSLVAPPTEVSTPTQSECGGDDASTYIDAPGYQSSVMESPSTMTTTTATTTIME